MDTNWFYSTIAQSSAAIVGLMGAILVTKMLDLQKRAEEERTQLLRDVIQWKMDVLQWSNYNNGPINSYNGEDIDILKNIFDLSNNMTNVFPEISIIGNLIEGIDLEDIKNRSDGKNYAPFSNLKAISLKRMGELVRKNNSYIRRSSLTSYYQLIFMLVLLICFGMFIPMRRLAGFDINTFRYFSIAMVAFLVWLSAWIFKFEVSKKVVLSSAGDEIN